MPSKLPNHRPHPRVHRDSTSSNRAFYKSSRWRKLSEWYRRQEPLCEECRAHGYTEPASLTDHIIPINDGGDKWDADNLQALCMTCHNRKTASERGNV